MNLFDGCKLSIIPIFSVYMCKYYTLLGYQLSFWYRIVLRLVLVVLCWQSVEREIADFYKDRNNKTVLEGMKDVILLS